MGLSGKALLSIFNTSKIEMQKYSSSGLIDKFNKWVELENGKYDLVYSNDEK
jgi:hypothetical protein